MDADRVGCYKGRKTGFPGLACRHCVGQAGCGRYFPASEASLSQTTTSQTIVNHVRNCRRCPIDVREQLEFMKMSKAVVKKVRNYGVRDAFAANERTFLNTIFLLLTPFRVINRSMVAAKCSFVDCGAVSSAFRLMRTTSQKKLLTKKRRYPLEESVKIVTQPHLERRKAR